MPSFPGLNSVRQEASLASGSQNQLEMSFRESSEGLQRALKRMNTVRFERENVQGLRFVQ